MASITFFTPDGVEKKWKLLSHRLMRVGRDPGSDIILRDGRVSRHHAEVLFERGFFVLRDLDSANGSFVNGRKIKNAPLTEGAEIVLGDSRGRFSEELEASQPSTAITSAPESSAADEERHTRPHALPTAEGSSKSSADGNRPDISEAQNPFGEGASFIFDLQRNRESRSTVRDSDERALFVFRQPVTLVGFIAGLVSSTIALAGSAVTLFLWQQNASLRALIALTLTIGFAILVLALVPRQTIILRRSDDDLSPILTLQQENSAPAPIRRFLAGYDGKTIARFHKNVFSNLGKRRWWIVDESGDEVGYAVEDSLTRAILRKPFGSFLQSLRTDFEIVISGREIGLFVRRGGAGKERYVLELRDTSFDRRTAVALGLLLACVER